MPNDPPIERKKFAPAVAAPRSSWRHGVLYGGDQNLHHQPDARAEDEHEDAEREFDVATPIVPRRPSPMVMTAVPDDRERTIAPTLGDQLTGDDRRAEESDHHRQQSQSRTRRRHASPTSWKYSGRKVIAPNIAKPTTNPIAEADEKTRLAKRRGARTGSLERRSITTKTTPVTRPMTSKSDGLATTPTRASCHRGT